MLTSPLLPPSPCLPPSTFFRHRMVLTHCLERNQRYLGRIEPLLVEGVNARAGREGEVMGRTDTNRLTFFKGSPELIGQIVPVRITDVRAVSLTGELVSAAEAAAAAAAAAAVNAGAVA
ncbi:unnamed protein product [Closterium sp. NIES-54]